MREQDCAGLLGAARDRVAAVRAALVDPRACRVDECITLFREAQGYLEWLRDSLPRASTEGRKLRASAADMAVELRQTGILLERASRAGAHWLERLRSTPPGYTADGNPTPLGLRGSLSLLG